MAKKLIPPSTTTAIRTVNIPVDGEFLYDSDTQRFYSGDGATLGGLELGGSVTDGDKGDITVSGSGSTWTIDNTVVTYPKIQDVSGASLILGRGDSGSGSVQEITLGTNLSITGTTLNASGSGVSDADYGDITVSGSGTVWTIDNTVVTYAKIQDTGAASILLGRGDSGTGSPQEITLGTNLSITGTTLNATGSGVSDSDYGDITVTGSGTVWTIDSDAVTYDKIQDTTAADVLLGRGNGGGSGTVQEITLGTNLSLTGTVLNASGSGVSDADYGDIIVSGSGTVWTIDNTVVTYAKIQDTSSASILIGRGDSGTGSIQELTLGTNLSISGTTLNATGGVSDGDKGDITVTGSGATWTIDSDAVTYDKIQDTAAASVLLGRGNASAGTVEEITLGTNLSITGTTLNASGGGSGLTVVLTASATVAATAGNLYLLNGTTTVNLPVGNNGDLITLSDYGGTFSSSSLTINRAGSDTITSDSLTSLTLDRDYASVELVFHSGVWTIYSGETFNNIDNRFIVNLTSADGGALADNDIIKYKGTTFTRVSQTDEFLQRLVYS